MKKLFNFYISASIHVALAVYSLVRITEFYFDLPYNKTLDCFIFYATITGYNFVKYVEIANLHPKKMTVNLKLIQLFSMICFLLTVFYASKLPLKTLLFFVPFGVLTLLYAVPFFAKNLRNIASLKIIIIALVWAGVTVLLPLFAVKRLDMSLFQILAFFQRFLFVIVITLPFDIRDLPFDDKKLGTIPQKIGVEKTKQVGFVLWCFCLWMEFFIAPNSNFKNVFLGMFFVVLYLLMRATTNQSKYYSSFWVEAIPIFWFIFFLISNKTFCF